MEPVKKNRHGKKIIVVTCFIILVIIITLAMHISVAMYNTSTYLDTTTINVTYMNVFSIKLNESLEAGFFSRLNLRYWNDNTISVLLIFVVIYGVILIQIFADKKKYIAGKEHGTAEWAGPDEIKKLSAKYILQKEQNKVWFRWFKEAFTTRLSLSIAATFKSVPFKLKPRFEFYVKKYKGPFRTKYLKYKKAQIEALDKEIEEIKQSGISLRKGAVDEQIEKATQKTKDRVNAEYLRYRQDLFTFLFYNVNIEKISDKGKKQGYLYKSRCTDLKFKYANADAPLTKTEKISIYNFIVNNNCLIIGGAGAGKSRGYAMPNILQAHSSYVITDPKGEILAKSYPFLLSRGYDVRVLNLDNKRFSDNYNPFAYINPDMDGYEENVMTLIQTIIINTDAGEHGKPGDPFWERAERLFLQAIFFFVCAYFPKEQRNMERVLELISWLQIEEERDQYNSKLDYFAKYFAMKMLGLEIPEGGIHKCEKTMKEQPWTKCRHIGYMQYLEFRSKASGKTAKSIVMCAVTRLAPFRIPTIEKMLLSDSMDLYELGKKKMAIFVVVSPTDNTFNFIAGMLFTQMFQAIQYCATVENKHKGQRLDMPVRFILDEFANTCNIPNFVKILAYARSFGVGIVPIVQSLEQLKTMYEKEWGVVIDNCSSMLFLGSVSHMETLKYISERLGKGTFDKKTTGRTRGRQAGSSRNYDVIGRELLDPSEIDKMPKNKCLLFVSGFKPFYSEKNDFSNHPNYKYTPDADPSNFKEYIPIHLRAAVEEIENKNKEAGVNETAIAKMTPGDDYKVHDDEDLLSMLLSQDAGLAYISPSDEGSGINPLDLERVFKEVIEEQEETIEPSLKHEEIIEEVSEEEDVLAALTGVKPIQKEIVEPNKDPRETSSENEEAFVACDLMSNEELFLNFLDEVTSGNIDFVGKNDYGEGVDIEEVKKIIIDAQDDELLISIFEAIDYLKPLEEMIESVSSLLQRASKSDT